jgi:acetyl esterase/lipase
MRIISGLTGLLIGLAAPVFAQPPAVHPAIYTDPAGEGDHRAGMEVLHIPVGPVAINGVLYRAAGSGTHPTLLILHGLPGNEKNLDLAQAVRRAGWNAVTINYRGSWGSPGRFTFAGTLEDARAALAYLRDPANAARLGVDPARIVLAGHSMGGWVTAMTAAEDRALAGAILISAANMGRDFGETREQAIAGMADNMESLAGTSAAAMADELAQGRPRFDWTPRASALARAPLLVLSSDDGLGPMTEALARAARAAPGSRVTAIHVATDHGWSDRRIRLQHEIITWLEALR